MRGPSRSIRVPVTGDISPEISSATDTILETVPRSTDSSFFSGSKNTEKDRFIPAASRASVKHMASTAPASKAGRGTAMSEGLVMIIQEKFNNTGIAGNLLVWMM